MTSQELIQSCLNDLKQITKAEICLLGHNQIEIATTFASMNLKAKDIAAFAQSAADSQNIAGHVLMKIDDAEQHIVILRGEGSDSYLLGRIVVSEISHILKAMNEELDEKQFYQELFDNKLENKEILQKADELGILENVHRVAYLVEVDKEMIDSGLEILINLFDEEGKDYAAVVDRNQLVLIKSMKNKKEEAKLEEYAQQIASMFNTEIMASVRVTYGNVANSILEVGKTYREAKVAQEVAKIFYDGRMVAGYSSLGIGRLIHELPLSLCEMFLDEVFGDKKLKLSEEELNTIDKFFDNNLNISETARELFMHRNTLVYHLEKLQKATGLDIRKFDDALTFKIATMVARYMKYLSQK